MWQHAQLAQCASFSGSAPLSHAPRKTAHVGQAPPTYPPFTEPLPSRGYHWRAKRTTMDYDTPEEYGTPREYCSYRTQEYDNSDYGSQDYGEEWPEVAHAEIRRCHSYRAASSSDRRQPRRELERRRPATLHIRRSGGAGGAGGGGGPIPEVNVEAFDIERKRSQQAEMELAKLRVHSEVPTFRSSSASPRQHPHGHGCSTSRRDSMASLNRVWKSDECRRNPAIHKCATLDVPSGELVRQLSLSDSLVNGSEYVAPIRRICSLTLTVKQRRSLKTSFYNLNSGGTFLKIIEQIFRRLESKCPDIRSIFLTTAFVNSLSRERMCPVAVKTEYDHCKCLVALFERLMENVDDLDKHLVSLRQYGEKHAQMKESGFTGAMIEHFGEIAVAVIGSQECVKYNHDTVKAWRLLLAFITDEMKVGYDRATRINERRSSNQDCYQR